MFIILKNVYFQLLWVLYKSDLRILSTEKYSGIIKIKHCKTKENNIIYQIKVVRISVVQFGHCRFCSHANLNLRLQSFFSKFMSIKYLWSKQIKNKWNGSNY